MYNYNYGCGCGAKSVTNIPSATRANGSQTYNTSNTQMPYYQDTQTTTGKNTTDIFDVNQPPQVIGNIGYTQGYLKSKIGKRVQIEFLIGTTMLVDRGGTLVDVGISYVVIRETATGNLVMGDLYSIKFVTFYD